METVGRPFGSPIGVLPSGARPCDDAALCGETPFGDAIVVAGLPAPEVSNPVVIGSAPTSRQTGSQLRYSSAWTATSDRPLLSASKPLSSRSPDSCRGPVHSRWRRAALAAVLRFPPHGWRQA